MKKFLSKRRKGYIGRRFLSLTLILSLLMPAGLMLHPKKTEAFFVTTAEVPASPLFLQSLQWCNKEVGPLCVPAGPISFDGIAWLIAKIIIKQITASIVTWINQGFPDGGPGFISNPEAFFADVVDQEIGAFIYGSDLGFLCSPFQLEIRGALDFRKPFRQRAQCTLTQIVGNIDNFINGIETQIGGAGGWNGWFSMTTQPQNNPYGAYEIARGELEVRIAGKTVLQGKIADWGKGFLSFSDPICEANKSRAREIANDVNQDSEIRRRNSQLTVSSCPIRTPGSFIESQLSNALGTDIRQLELADEINEIVTAALVQLTKMALGEIGLFGLSNSTGVSGSGDFVNNLNNDINNDFGTARVSIATQLDQSISDAQPYIDQNQQNINRAQQSENLLRQLMSCYQQKSTDPLLSSGDQATALQRRNAASTTLDTQILPDIERFQNNILETQQGIDSARGLRDRLDSLSVESIFELNSLIEEFRQRVTPHSSSEISALQSELPNYDTLDTDTRQKIDECNAFPAASGNNP